MNDPEGTHRPRYCRVCRLEYEPIDRQHHRRRHTEWMRPRRPKPSPRFADNVDVIVDETSPTRLHKLVYERARALMRDEGFSSNPQWNIDCAPEPRSPGGRIHAILLVEDSTPVGAAGFAYTYWADAPPGWHLNFAWIAEPWRRKGVMSRRWPRWRATYGEFTLEQPFSEAMANFLAKHGLAVNDEELSRET
jgi:hypothetical protein